VTRRRANRFVGRVLVTDGEQRASLAACRSLAEAGYEVTVAAARRPAAGHWSRACAVRLLTTDPDVRPDGFVSELAAFAREHRCDALLPGSDRSVLLISQSRASFADDLLLGLPDQGAVTRSLDKIALLEAAANAGLDAPPSRVCRSRKEILAAADDLTLPVVLKPWRTVLSTATGLRQQAIAIARSRVELEDASHEGSGPCIVQRFEPFARRLSCGGLMTDDGITGFLVAEFQRTWPPAAGAVSFGETVAAPYGLAERAQELLRTIGWRGIFELEVLDLGHERFAAIDLNPRVFGWLALAVAAGVDLPRLWIEWVTGRRPRGSQPVLGVRYRWEDAELAGVAWQVSRGNLREAAGIARPRRRVVHAHFRARDPGPLAGRLLEVATRRLRAG
jgi:predicted ATP-grasp superfamily ATP-dependent carboligase